MARIECIRWWRYAIPFRLPFYTAHGVLTQREGVLLQATTDEGRSGWGEIAPLPGFGGSLEKSWRLLPAMAELLLGWDGALVPLTNGDEETNRWPGNAPPQPLLSKLERGLSAARAGSRRLTVPLLAPAGERGETLRPCSAAHRQGIWSDMPAALRSGVETAVGDLRAQAASCTLAALLTPQPAMTVPVNATVGAADTAGAVKQAALAVAAGFATIKLKVGLGASIGAEVERVAAVREAIGPNLQLRLDANEAWTSEMAIEIIRAYAPYRVEWVEQPVAAVDVAGLARARRAVETPIAADESVTGEEAVQALLAAEAADVLILKPMLAGGPAATQRLAALAAAAGVSAIVTSTLETGIGLAAAVHAAAALPPPLRACGLATAALLESDLLEQPLPIVDGQMRRPETAGLGVQVNWQRLRNYTTAIGEVGLKR